MKTKPLKADSFNILDDEDIGELYEYTEDDVLPFIGNLLEDLHDNKKQRSVWLKKFHFKKSTHEKVLNLVQAAGIDEPERFIIYIGGTVQQELARLELEKINRDKKQPSPHELLKFGEDAKKIIRKFLDLSDNNRTALVQNMTVGLRHVFDVPIGNFSDETVIRFLHLLEATAMFTAEDTTKYQRNTPIFFVHRLWTIWSGWVPDTSIRGNATRFKELVTILLEVTGQPRSDPKNLINSAKRGKIS